MVLVHVLYDTIVYTSQTITVLVFAIVGTSGNPDIAMKRNSTQNMMNVSFNSHFAVCINLH